MHRLGMTFLISHPQSPALTDQLEIYAGAGFDSVFIGSGTVSDLECLAGLSEKAHSCDIFIEAFHAPSEYADRIWSAEKSTAETAFKKLCDTIDACRDAKIGKIVTHAACSSNIKITDEGLCCFTALEKYADSKGVVICYENANVLSPLAAVLDNASKNHGFCFDCGHQLCYSPNSPLIENFGRRMLYTHLHDNDGKGDRHYMPFDGIRDWNALAKNLAFVKYTGTLNLELACHSSPAYREMNFNDFVKKAHSRLVRFSELVEKYE